MSELFNHLWQSTAFAAAVALAALALRKNSPRVRYWVWLAASMKFLIPFSLLVSSGAKIQLPPDTPTLHAVTVQRISTYFAPVSTPTAAPHATFQWTRVFAVIWLIGATFLLIRWFKRWRAIHSSVSQATPLPLRLPVPACSSTATMEPGVFGVFRPVLLLPEGITDTLTPGQLEVVIAHELRHVRYRDNLTAALHMCVETLFWFHPLVWWIGARLMDERERDCDAAVLSQGSHPAEYARGIVQVCESYVESPLDCVSGISGSDLKKRIRDIMRWRRSLRLTFLAKAVLVAASLVALLIPFGIGILRAQSLTTSPANTYDVVSIHRSDPAATNVAIVPGPQGGLHAENTTTMLLLNMAYNAQNYQILGAPGWVAADHFDVTFTPDKTDTPPGPGAALKDSQAYMSRNQQRLQAVLRDRFGLVLRAETRELPIYALTMAKGGNKFAPHTPGKAGPVQRTGRGQVTSNGMTLDMLALRLTTELHRPVHNETGLDGQFDFRLEWTPDPESTQPHPEETSSAPSGGASIFTAVTDQLGLKLESKKGPVQVYVIEKITPPTEN